MPAIPFIVVDEQTGVYTLHPEAAAFLASLNDEPLVIAAVAGKYRTGKSSLLNRALLNVSGAEGFGVGGSINAHTKGLWLNTNMLRVERGASPSKSQTTTINLLVIDTEGLGALTATDTHDTRIFALALLVSSYFIYNSVGTIDESTINTLSLVANISKHVRVRSSDDNDDDDDKEEKRMPIDDDNDGKEETSAAASASTSAAVRRARELGDHFPHFLWVVRDFTLKMVDQNGAPITESQYLEQALGDMPVPPHAEQKQADLIAEKNRLRTLLRAYFPHRDCATLVRPVNTEEELQRLDSMPDSQLRPEFLKQAKRLRNKVLREAPIKTAMGGKRAVSGRMLVRLCQAYIDALNAGAAPVIRDSWALLAEAQFRDAIDRAERTFKSHLAALQLPIDCDLLRDAIENGKRAAVDTFENDAPEHDDTPAHVGFLRRLREGLDELSLLAETENEHAIEALARHIADSVESNVFSSSDGGGNKWVDVIEAIRRRYEGEFVGKLRQTASRAGSALSTVAGDIWARVWHQRLLNWPRQFCARMERQIETLGAQLVDCESRFSAAQQQLLETQQTIAALQAKEQKDESKREQFRADLEAEYESTLQQARDSLLVARKERDEAQDALANCKAELEMERASNNNNNNILIDNATDSADEKEQKQLSDEQIEALATVKQLRASIARANQTAALDAEQSAAMVDEARRAAARAQTDAQQLQRELDDAQSEFGEQLARIQDDAARTMAELKRARDAEQSAKEQQLHELRAALDSANDRAKTALEKAADKERCAAADKERLETKVRTLADKAEKRESRYDEQERAMKKAHREQAERHDKALQQMHDDRRAEAQKRAEEALAERQSLTLKCIDADRRAARLEEQRAALQRRIDEYGDIGEFRKTQIECERVQALLERSDAELKTLRAAAFEARQRGEETTARIVALEKQLKDQERQFELAKLRLKMDYELESARQRSSSSSSVTTTSIPSVTTTPSTTFDVVAPTTTADADNQVKRRRFP